MKIWKEICLTEHVDSINQGQKDILRSRILRCQDNRTFILDCCGQLISLLSAQIYYYYTSKVKDRLKIGIYLLFLDWKIKLNAQQDLQDLKDLIRKSKAVKVK